MTEAAAVLPGTHQPAGPRYLGRRIHRDAKVESSVSSMNRCLIAGCQDKVLTRQADLRAIGETRSACSSPIGVPRNPPDSGRYLPAPGKANSQKRNFASLHPR